MSGKIKIQISRSLDERIKRIISGSDEYQSSEFAQVDTAYILGFHQANITNCVGLTTNYKLHHVVLPIVGLVFFKTSPSDQVIGDSLKLVKKDSGSKSDDIKNNNLFLIYYVDQTTTNNVEKKIFNLESGNYLETQPKLSVLDDNKIYNHSCLIKLNMPLKLNIYDDKKLLAYDKIEENLNELKKSFLEPTKDIKLIVKDSSYSINLGQANNKNTIEYLYDFLDVPSDVQQMGDYLPQMTKEDKKKLCDKWKNKMKNQRSPLEIDLYHDKLSYNEESESKDKNQYYLFKLSFYLYIHVNDTILKTVQSILTFICHKIDLLKYVFETFYRDKNICFLELEELKCCTFKPTNVGHLIQTIYAIPEPKHEESDESNKRQPEYEILKELRHKIHTNYLIPFNRPQFRYSQRIFDLTMKNSDEQSGYLCNVHHDIAEQSGIKQGLRNIIEGTYTYHHYMQHSFNDNGWGCAYRSLQTIISWFKHQAYIYSPDIKLRAPAVSTNKPDKTSSLRLLLNKESRVPTHHEIQSVLVDVGVMGDKLLGSTQWIGSQEVCYVLNHLYDIDCKFINVSSGSELVDKARDLAQHFTKQSTPVMIGGGVLAHTIIGIDFNEKNGDISYLILDPHYTGGEDLSTITKKGWCGWKKNSFWNKGSFYNLCLPQIPLNEY